MVIDCFSGIVSIILFPDQIHNKFIGKYPIWIYNEQRQNIKFFSSKFDFFFSYFYNTLFYTKK